MSTTIKIRNSVSASVTPVTLEQGEFAVNITDKKLWVGNSTSTPVLIANNATLQSPLAVGGNSTAGAEIRLPEDTDNGSNYIALKAANSIASNLTLTLPAADGSANNFLKTDGSGTLAFGNTLTNPTITNYVETLYNIGTLTTSHTIDLTNGTVQQATLTASTACTFTMPTATAGKSFTLFLRQPASTGNASATFTGVIFNATYTMTTTAGYLDILTFISDGTSWYGNAALSFDY